MNFKAGDKVRIKSYCWDIGWVRKSYIQKHNLTKKSVAVITKVWLKDRECSLDWNGANGGGWSFDSLELTNDHNPKIFK